MFIATGNGSTTSPHQHAVHPSFVPSLLSSFANSPNNASQSKIPLLLLIDQNANWLSSAVITSQEDSKQSQPLSANNRAPATYGATVVRTS